ncbi:hypothetical protein [Mesorhizobium sp. L-8-10]|uniref:hypothetical protein n=1 Tax=Mesorhizobium sp. L-8-10 TaxID=2744523 RepID=UPI0019293433|nr:hypothetical protein [Mesorhizobium sp. L-8-10]
MVERAYTVKEIDELREVVQNAWLYGSYHGATPQRPFSRAYNEAEKTRCVEEMVRTHMLAGHTAEDLLASEAKPDGAAGFADGLYYTADDA